MTTPTLPDLPLCDHGFTLPPSPAHASQCAACLWAEVLRLRAELARWQRAANALPLTPCEEFYDQLAKEQTP